MQKFWFKLCALIARTDTCHKGTDNCHPKRPPRS